MKSYLLPLWDKAMKLLGPVGPLIPTIAKSIKKDLKAGDVEKVQAHAKELLECAEQMALCANYLIEITADGTIDLDETARVAINFERLLDEAEDVATGVDEDDPPAT